MPEPRRPLDPSLIPSTSVRERKARLLAEQLAALPDPAAPAVELLASLPKVGMGRALNQAARILRDAARRQRPIIALAGAPLYAAGYSALLASLIDRDALGAVALSGAAAVADFELAYFGQTDEDPAASTYGMAREVGEVFNAIVNEGVSRGFGLGEFLGRALLERRPRHAGLSVMAHGAAKRIPVTVHPTFGADPAHRATTADGALLGKGAQRDFLLLAGQLPALNDGGVAVDLWSDGLGGVFGQMLAAASQAEETPSAGWRHLRFSTDLPPRPEARYPLEGIETLHIQGDPLLLSVLFLGLDGE